MSRYEDFIDDNYIEQLIAAPQADVFEIRDILAKSREKKGLSPEDVAKLVCCDKQEIIEELFETASQMKRDIYGNRIVFFAPLYINNFCSNDCLYCAFRASNTLVRRHRLTDEELRQEVLLLEAQGHKRLILVFGEAPSSSAQFISDTVKQVYATKTYNQKGLEIGSIRRININAAPMEVADYKIVKEAGIGTFQVFQETYHKKTYQYVHPQGTKKGDYLWRLHSLHRAQEGGIDDVGIGALFGLYDWRFEVVSLIRHANSLEKHFAVGPHTISFPRVEPAFNTPYADALPYRVKDEDFKKIIAIIRIAVPYTGLILTCRESAAFRNEVIKLGISQIDAGSKIGIGGYSEAAKRGQIEDMEQFKLGDARSLNEVIEEILKDHYIPSFCTACYRLGRTGEHFMAQAKPGLIKKFCEPNAILTFYEYLLDYASEETRNKAAGLIAEMLQQLDARTRPLTEQKLTEIKSGARDVLL